MEQPLQRAEAALGRGDFADAVDALDAALTDPHADQSTVATAHLLTGGIQYADDRMEDARASWESAYRGFRATEDDRRAARAAILLAEVQSGSLGNYAVGLGWLARAKRLLDRVGPCVDWGWYELAFIACDRPDVDELARSAERALRIAEEYGDNDLEVRALADIGLALVSQGHRREGFARLDEAMAAILGGEVHDPAVASSSFCAMLSSCERTGDVRRAEEWMHVVTTQLLDPLHGRPRVLHTHCRIAYGSVLSHVGRWPEAEAALLDALRSSASGRVGHRIEATARLAELRLEQGHVDEAAQLLAPYEHAVPVCLPLAQVHLARGEPDRAIATARRSLRELVGDVSRGVPLLALVVEAELARTDVDAAERAAAELVALAPDGAPAILLAERELALGRVAAARDDHGAAMVHFEAAQRHVERDARPLSGALVRLDLAESLAASGDVAGAIGEAQLALRAFEQLGAVARADRTRALLRRLGAPAGRGVPATERMPSLTARETEVVALLGEGLTNAEIAARLFISAKTAEHHVGRILTKLGVRSRAEAAAVAAASRHAAPRDPK